VLPANTDEPPASSTANSKLIFCRKYRSKVSVTVLESRPCSFVGGMTIERNMSPHAVDCQSPWIWAKSSRSYTSGVPSITNNVSVGDSCTLEVHLPACSVRQKMNIAPHRPLKRRGSKSLTPGHGHWILLKLQSAIFSHRP
jgi:hypothetical protein